MALADILAGAAEGDALVEQAVVADFRRRADDDAGPVVDDQPPSDFGRRVDLDAGEEFGELREEAGEKTQAVGIKPMGGAVEKGGVEAVVEQRHFQRAARRRVVFPVRADVFNQMHGRSPPK